VRKSKQKLEVWKAVQLSRSFKNKERRTEREREFERSSSPTQLVVAPLLTEMTGSNDLGLLSDVASTLDPPPIDPSLIDPSLLPPHARIASTLNRDSIPQHSTLHADEPTRNGWHGDISIGEFQVGSSCSTGTGGARSVRMEIDPSLQSLSNDLQLDFTGIYHAPSRHSQASNSDDDDEEEGDSQGSEGGDYQLSQTPKDVNEQILELRDMDDQATKTLEENSKYQTELNKLMERFQKASKRTTELKVRPLLSPV